MGASRTARPGGPAPARDSAGISMIEVLMVLVVISIGILAIAGIQTHSSSDVYATGRRSTALAVAETQMETTRALGYSQAVSAAGATGIYNWTSVVAPAGTELSQITVTVKWTVKGVPDSIKLYDLISNR